MQRLAQAFRSYAAQQRWQPDDYQVFVYFNEDWGQLHLVLVVKKLPCKDWEDSWQDVFEYLEKDLKDEPQVRDALHLVIHTFDQVAEGGLYSIGDNYQDINDLLLAPAAAPRPRVT